MPRQRGRPDAQQFESMQRVREFVRGNGLYLGLGVASASAAAVSLFMQEQDQRSRKNLIDELNGKQDALFARAPPESSAELKQEWRGDAKKPLWAAHVTTVQARPWHNPIAGRTLHADAVDQPPVALSSAAAKRPFLKMPHPRRLVSGREGWRGR